MRKLILLVLVGIVCTTRAVADKSLPLKTNATIINDSVKARGINGPGHDNIDKSYDTQLTAMKSAVVPKFKTYSYEDKKVGRTMNYNLFLPKGYDGKKTYPIVLFMPDASTVGKGASWALEQGYGGIIWATDENQAKNPCIVLVPSFDGKGPAVNDQWQTSDEVAIIPDLLKFICSNYKVDSSRIYATGQSMGGMISFYLNVTHPNLFAASMFVSSQWDTNVLQALVGKKFIYLVSDGDAKASPKMTELEQLISKNGEKYSEVTFSARLPIAEQNAKVDSIISEGNIANFVRFTPKTVMPEGRESQMMAEHMYAFDHAYLLDPAREWLFKQKNMQDPIVNNILTRTSIRAYQDKAVEADKIETLLRAGMAAPSAVNRQPWHFIVVTDKQQLSALAKANPNAGIAAKAPLAIVVCGDMNKALEGGGRDFWIQDASAASENILLSAHALGLGAVWTGTYPSKDHCAKVAKVLKLPDYIIPLNTIVIGYPAENPTPKEKFTQDNISYDVFGGKSTK